MNEHHGNPGFIEQIKSFYDDVYFRDTSNSGNISRHHRGLADKLNIRSGEKLLDVGCGTGSWLLAAGQRGALLTGIDLSDRAIEICRSIMPHGDFQVGQAETLPFPNNTFELITCLGSLEHFVDKPSALAEMLRVGTTEARYVILVPNADFLTRRMGLFKGTQQASIKEDVLTLDEWKQLFERSGFRINERWPDFHVLSMDWIMRGSLWQWGTRFVQALMLVVWPLQWQYQVYHLCRKHQTED